MMKRLKSTFFEVLTLFAFLISCYNLWGQGCNLASTVVTGVNGICLQDGVINVNIPGATNCTGNVARLYLAGQTNLLQEKQILTDGTVSFENLAAGNYTVSLFDGVTVLGPYNVTLTTSYVNFVATAVGTHLTCAPTATYYSYNGKIDATASGGIGPYTVTVTGGSQNVNITQNIAIPGGSTQFTGLANGTYSVVISDVNPYCSRNQTFTINLNNGLSQDFDHDNTRRIILADCSINLRVSMEKGDRDQTQIPGNAIYYVGNNPNSLLLINNPYNSTDTYYTFTTPNGTIPPNTNIKIVIKDGCYRFEKIVDTRPIASYVTEPAVTRTKIKEGNTCVEKVSVNVNFNVLNNEITYFNFPPNSTVKTYREDVPNSNNYVLESSYSPANMWQTPQSYTFTLNQPDKRYRVDFEPPAGNTCVQPISKFIDARTYPLEPTFLKNVRLDRAFGILEGTEAIDVKKAASGTSTTSWGVSDANMIQYPVELTVTRIDEQNSITINPDAPYSFAGSYTINFPFVFTPASTTWRFGRPLIGDLPPGGYRVVLKDFCQDTVIRTINLTRPATYNEQLSVTPQGCGASEVTYSMLGTNLLNQARVYLTHANGNVPGTVIGNMNGTSALNGTFSNITPGNYFLHFKDINYYERITLGGNAHHSASSTISAAHPNLVGNNNINQNYYVPFTVLPTEQITFKTVSLFCDDQNANSGIITVNVEGQPIDYLRFRLYNSVGYTPGTTPIASFNGTVNDINYAFTGLAAGTYIVEVESRCNTKQQTVILSTGPVTYPRPTASIRTVCQDAPTILTMGLPASIFTMTWYNANDLNTPVGTGSSINVNPSASGAYQVNYNISLSGCSNNTVMTDTVMVNVLPKALQLGAAITECSADGLTYTVRTNLQGTGPWTVIGTGAPGAIVSNGDGTFAFTSGNISDGTAYNIAINDVNDCNTITLTDASPSCCTLTYTCPSAISIDCGLTTATANTGNVVINSSCSGSPTITFVDGSSTANGNIIQDFTRTFTIVDNAVTRTCTQQISVIDNVAPVIANCPTTINVSTAAGSCDAVVTWTAPTATDNCSSGANLTFTSNFNSNSSFDLGTHTVTYTATDLGGNQSTCSFDIFVTDQVPPTFVESLPADQTLSCLSELPAAPILTATDNCSTANVIMDEFETGLTEIVSLGISTVLQDSSTYSLSQSPSGGNATIVFKTGSQPTTLRDFTIGVMGMGTSSTVVNLHYADPTNYTLGAQVTTIGSFTNPVGNAMITLSDANNTLLSPNTAYAIQLNTTGTVLFRMVNLINDPVDQIATDLGWQNLDNNSGVDVDGIKVPFLYRVRVRSYEPIACDNKKRVVRNYTATDGAGNVNVHQQVITINDNVPPTITSCPQGGMTPFDANCSFTIPNYTADVVATDNCSGGLTITQVPAANTVVTTNTDVIITVTDICGNSSTCTVNLTFDDVTPPQIVNCPSNQTINVLPGTCGATATWVAPTATDNCSSVTLTSDFASGFNFPVGPTVVTYTAQDMAGNSQNCSFTITVVDNEAPVIVGCPSPITVNTSTDLCSSPASWTPPTATDNCTAEALLTWTSTATPGSIFNYGINSVTYTVTDAAGNSASCNFAVTVFDGIAPVVTCPSTVTVYTSATSCEAVATWSPATAVDNCTSASDLTIVSSPQSGTVFPLGTTQVTYTVTDAANNTSSCQFDVEVIDNVLPTIVCPSNITANTSAESCGNVVSWTEPAVSDNCTISPTVTTTHTSGSTFGLGSTTVTYTVTDAANNVNTCSFVVNVVDNVAPVIVSCPTTQTVYNTASSCTAAATWTPPTATDNCTDASSITWTSNYNPGATFQLGTNTVNYIASDAAGNQQVCTFDVIVVDNVAPVPVCPPTVTVYTPVTSCEAVATWNSPIASDNCTDASSITWTRNYNPGATFQLGTTQVTYTATDAASNSSSCTFDVVVIDNVQPTLTCPSDVTVTTLPSSCENIATWNSATVVDNCTISPTITSSHASGTSFGLGTTVVTYTATDASGNTSTCTFNVLVEDDVDPIIANCPSTITVYTEATTCDAVATWTAPTATDNCTDAAAITWASTSNPGATFPLGTTAVTYTATDASGNNATCTFDVIVIDNVNPILDNCPSNFTVYATSTTCDAVATWTPPTATDNCTTTPVLTSDFNSGDVFSIGATTVTYTATDLASNSVTCSFIITVVDTVKPVIANCPNNFSINNDLNVCSAVTTWTAPTATDNCSVSTFTSSHNSGVILPVGPHTITYTATDDAGNSSTCSFVVTVVDAQNPQVAIQLSKATYCDGDVVSWKENITDNCGVGTVNSSHDNNSVFAIGTTTVTYTVRDIHNNLTTYTFDVIVNPLPTVSVKQNVYDVCMTDEFSISVQNPISNANYSWTHHGMEVATGTELVYLNTNESHRGQHIVTVTDLNGCMQSDTFQLNVNICALQIPEIISPNGDGANEVFVIPYLELYPNTKVWIHNRWGALVYQNDDYQNDWDGRSTNQLNIGGDELPEGTFFYILELGGDGTFPNSGAIYKGYVYIKR